ncbi:hypothetical protein HUS23_11890 [Ectothiorhodospiraceae bacterium 2226]|nr:hypothetical protein HUS23_11890 [Ectothiorhodospiraceae bacterium 2226]
MRRGITTRWRRLQHSACEKHLLPRQTRYGRFILLGMGRSGSNLIRSALTCHPGVVMFNELFNDARATHRLGAAKLSHHRRGSGPARSGSGQLPLRRSARYATRASAGAARLG